MTPQSLFAAALRMMAIWFVSWGIMTPLAIVTGPFNTLVFGIVLLLCCKYWLPIERSAPSPTPST